MESDDGGNRRKIRNRKNDLTLESENQKSDLAVVEAVESDDGGNDDGAGTNNEAVVDCRRLGFHPEMMKKMVVGRRTMIYSLSVFQTLTRPCWCVALVHGRPGFESLELHFLFI